MKNTLNKIIAVIAMLSMLTAEQQSRLKIAAKR